MGFSWIRQPRRRGRQLSQILHKSPWSYFYLWYVPVPSGNRVEMFSPVGRVMYGHVLLMICEHVYFVGIYDCEIGGIGPACYV
jgi:hypothetical protein